MRKPIRRRHASSGVGSAGVAQRHVERVERLLAVAPRPPQRPGRRPSSGQHAPCRPPAGPSASGRRAGDARPPPAAGADPVPRSTSTCTSTGAVAAGRRSRAAAPRPAGPCPPGCRVTGRQMPAVTSVGPPVPAEVAGHLADGVVRVAVDVRPGARAAGSAASAVSVLGERRRRRARCRPSTSTSPHVEAVGAVHVRRSRPSEAAVERRPWRRCRGRRRPGRPARRRRAAAARRSSRTRQSVRPIQASSRSLSSRYGSGIRPAASRSVCTQPGHRRRNGPAASDAGGHRPGERAQRPAVVQGGHHWRFLGSGEGVSCAELSADRGSCCGPVGVPVVSNLI